MPFPCRKRHGLGDSDSDSDSRNRAGSKRSGSEKCVSSRDMALSMPHQQVSTYSVMCSVRVGYVPDVGDHDGARGEVESDVLVVLGEHVGGTFQTARLTRTGSIAVSSP